MGYVFFSSERQIPKQRQREIGILDIWKAVENGSLPRQCLRVSRHKSSCSHLRLEASAREHFHHQPPAFPPPPRPGELIGVVSGVKPSWVNRLDASKVAQHVERET
jgi:hypothetical protein